MECATVWMDDKMIDRCIAAAALAANAEGINGKDLVISVIKAMREPTEKMLKAADDTFEDRNYDRRDDLKTAYQAMIDSILND